MNSKKIKLLIIGAIAIFITIGVGFGIKNYKKINEESKIKARNGLYVLTFPGLLPIHNFTKYNRCSGADCCRYNSGSHNRSRIYTSVLAPKGNDIHRD